MLSQDLDFNMVLCFKQSPPGPSDIGPSSPKGGHMTTVQLFPPTTDVGLSPAVHGICYGCKRPQPLSHAHISTIPAHVETDFSTYESGGHAPYERAAQTHIVAFCSDCAVGGG